MNVKLTKNSTKRGLIGYRRDKNNPAIFIPDGSILGIKMYWTKEEIAQYEKHCDSPTFVESLKRYNKMVQSGSI